MGHIDKAVEIIHNADMESKRSLWRKSHGNFLPTYTIWKKCYRYSCTLNWQIKISIQIALILNQCEGYHSNKECLRFRQRQSPGEEEPLREKILRLYSKTSVSSVHLEKAPKRNIYSILFILCLALLYFLNKYVWKHICGLYFLLNPFWYFMR